MRAIPAPHVADQQVASVLRAMKQALEEQDKQIATLTASVQSQRNQKPKVIERTTVQRTTGGGGSAFEPNELMQAPFPPAEPQAQVFIAPGITSWWGGPLANIPDGWLRINGQTLNISEYPDLYAAIGTTWGTGGAGTFNLPPGDVYLKGVSTSPHAESLGDTVGEDEKNLEHKHAVGTYATDGAGGHDHTVSGNTGSAGSHNHGGSTGTPSATSPAGTLLGDAADNVHTHSISSDGTHDHSVSLTTSAVIDHTHTLTGESAINVYTDLTVTDPVDIRPRTAVGYWIIKT